MGIDISTVYTTKYTCTIMFGDQYYHIHAFVFQSNLFMASLKEFERNDVWQCWERQSWGDFPRTKGG